MLRWHTAHRLVLAAALQACSLLTAFVQDTQACGVGAAYTATLTSTADILQALREAHICQRGIRAERSPAVHWAEPLPQIMRSDLQVAFRLDLSPNALLTAVSFHAQTSPHDGGPVTARDVLGYGVALYETHTGRLLRTLRSGDPHVSWELFSPYQIDWFPCSTKLSVFYKGTGKLHVFEAATGQSMPIPWLPLECALYQHHEFPVWSPDCRLVLRRWWDNDAYTFDFLLAADGSLVASTVLQREWLDPDFHDYAEDCWGTWLWHPTVQGGIVAACWSHLKTPHSLQAAGITMGVSPVPAHMDKSAAFSPSGGLLLAPVGTYGFRHHQIKGLTVFRCTESQHAFSFDILHSFDGSPCNYVAGKWCSMQQMGDVLMIDFGMGLQLLSPQGHARGTISDSSFQAEEFSDSDDYTFSPCGQLCQVMSCDAPTRRFILHCRSGTVHEQRSSANKPPALWPGSGSCMMRLTSISDFAAGTASCPYNVLRY